MNQLAKYIIGVAAALMVAFIAWYFSSIVVYIIISAVLSLMGKPIVEKLNTIRFKNYGVPRGISAAIALVTLFAVLISIFLVIAPLLGTFFSNIASIDIQSLGLKLSEPFEEFNRFVIKSFPSVGADFKAENLLFEEIKKDFTTSSVASIFASVTSLMMNTVLGLLIVMFITFFFLKENNMFDDMVLALFPERYEENAKRALKSINTLLVRYFIGISIQIIGITTLNTLGFHFIVGLELSYAIVLAFMTGVLNVIPYIGPWIGGVLGILITLTAQMPDSNVGSFVLSISGVILFTQLVDNFIFQPFIFSSSVKAHPLEIFLVTLIAAAVGGVLGMLVAIPSYTIIRVFAREFFSHFRLVQKLTDKIQS